MKINVIKCLSCGIYIKAYNLKRHSKSKSHLKNVDKKVNEMKMRSNLKYFFIDELIHYFKTHSKEEILRDWESVKAWDNVGPTVDEFLDELERRLTEALRNETKESLTQWIQQKRKARKFGKE